MAHRETEPASPPPARPGSTREAWPYVVIAAIVVALAAAFAWTAGWLSPQRLTAQRMVDAIEANGPPRPGLRRAHARGVCIAGRFESNGQGARWSRAGVLAAGRTPFTGRMSIGGGAPDGNEPAARVRSLALRLVQRDGQEWRMAMNSFPVMAVSTPQGFFEQTQAARPDPATGKPDPARIAAFNAAHPEGAAFKAWADSAPYTDSFATTAYHGVNAFVLVDAQDRGQAVRWTMQPVAPARALDKVERDALPTDYLQRELERRLAAAPVRWRMEVTLAQPGDPTHDPSRAWPVERERVVVGEAVVERAYAQADGDCRDVNFDPLVLPDGVRGSDDPILHARSAAYSVSAARRLRETAHGAAQPQQEARR